MKNRTVGRTGTWDIASKRLWRACKTKHGFAQLAVLDELGSSHFSRQASGGTFTKIPQIS